jgi:phosphatidylethanolamine-binding protein (PEBP) family uncharacterized protein
MYISSSIAVVALASMAYAQSQTPKGFKPAVDTKLELFFNTTSVKTPGELLPKATTMDEPRIAVASTNMSASDTFMFVMLDLDVPPAQGSTTRRVLLHAMNTGFKATQQKISGSATILSSKQKGPAMYLPPGPPATDTMAHRYVQLLFKEPATLKVQAADFANTTGRFNFDINSFMKENKLDMPIAGNFFMVDGRANSTAEGGSGNGGGNGNGRGRATGTGGGGARPTTVPFEGTAERRGVSYGLVGGVIGMVMLAL